MKKRQKENGLDLSKLSLIDLKKIEREMKCRSKDFQPFLEFSVWRLFGPIVDELIRECRDSLDFLRHSIGKLQVLNEEKILEHVIIQDLSKNIEKLNEPKQSSERKLKVKIVKADRNTHLYELFACKRKYSNFSKD